MQAGEKKGKGKQINEQTNNDKDGHQMNNKEDNKEKPRMWPTAFT